MLLIVFIFFSSVLHLFKNRSDHQIRLLSLPFAERANRAFLGKRSPTSAGRYKERIVIVATGRKLWHFALYLGGEKGFYIVSKKRRRVIKLCPRRAHRCGELSGKMTLCVLTRQTLKGRSLGLRSRNNTSFRYRRFKSKISFTHWHLLTEGYRDKTEGKRRFTS